MGNMTDNESVKIVTRWSDIILKDEDIVFLIRHALKVYSKEETLSIALTFKKWLQCDKRHIYTLWAPGFIPENVITTEKLDESCMAADDWKKHMKALKSQEEEIAKIKQEFEKATAASSEGSDEEL